MFAFSFDPIVVREIAAMVRNGELRARLVAIKHDFHPFEWQINENDALLLKTRFGYDVGISDIGPTAPRAR